MTILVFGLGAAIGFMFAWLLGRSRLLEARVEVATANQGLADARQQSVRGLLEPLKQQLDTYQSSIVATTATSADAIGRVMHEMQTLAQHNQLLQRETHALRGVLQASQSRGRWGEVSLRRILESAGMNPHADFLEQKLGDDGKPDVIVRLPGARSIIIDAKVPEVDGLDTDSDRAAVVLAHAQKLRSTIKSLADRKYPEQFSGAFDHVVLFVPAESLFSAALEGDPELINWAAKKRILLATPASLIALLRCVAMYWQQHAQTENAQRIAEAAQRLYTRVAGFVQHFAAIGSAIERAADAYNDAIGSYASRVRPQGERLVKLRGDDKDLPELAPLDAKVRMLA